MKPSTSAEQLFKNVLGQTALLTGLIASLGSLAGFIVEGMNGVVSALIGAGLAFAFGALTVVSMMIGRKLPGWLFWSGNGRVAYQANWICSSGKVSSGG